MTLTVNVVLKFRNNNLALHTGPIHALAGRALRVLLVRHNACTQVIWGKQARKCLLMIRGIGQ